MEKYAARCRVRSSRHTSAGGSAEHMPLNVDSLPSHTAANCPMCMTAAQQLLPRTGTGHLQLPVLGSPAAYQSYSRCTITMHPDRPLKGGSFMIQKERDDAS